MYAIKMTHMAFATQDKFIYDDLALSKLERSISSERLVPYQELAEGNLAYAIALYEWNTKVSGSLYGILQGFEVCLRNAIHEQLTSAVGRPDWYDAIGLEMEELRRVQDAKTRVLQAGKDITPGRVVAELMMGFWTALCGTAYAQRLWDKHLYRAFREIRLSRKDVAKRLKKIRYIRNRVAHHESIIGKIGNERDLRRDVAEIIEATGWICLTTAKWIANTSSFDDLYGTRPQKPAACLNLEPPVT